MSLRPYCLRLVLLFAGLLAFTPALAGASPIAAAAEEPVSTSASVSVSIDDSTERIDATYTTAEENLVYQGYYVRNAQGAAESFEATVSSESSGTFATGSFSRDHFQITLGKVVIDSSSPITEEQAAELEAFAKTEDATGLRKMLRALSVETASESSNYLVALTAMAMVIGNGDGGVAAQADDDCFGCCGPGCWGCTGCYTNKCAQHDQCVKDHGHFHFRCLAKLIPAIFSLVECALDAIQSIF